MRPEEVKQRNRAKLEAKRAQLAQSKESAQSVLELSQKIDQLTAAMKQSGITEAAQAIKSTADSLTTLMTAVKEADRLTVDTITRELGQLADRIGSLDITPEVNVERQQINIPDYSREFKNIASGLDSVVKAVDSLEFPKPPKQDNSGVEEAVGKVTSAISNLKFPVPNYVLPFKDSDGKSTQVVLDSSNAVPTSMYATKDDGTSAALNATPEGHLEVAIHDPRLPFGSVHTENMYPVFQSDGVYGINDFSMITSTGLAVGTGSGSGSASSSGNKLTVSTGTTQYSFASLQSRRRLRYRAGQGVIGRFAGYFSEPAANSILVAGFGTAETTLAFGYNGTSFGILYSTGGVREVHTFTVTTASTATNDYVVTLPNTATVNVTATNNSSTTQTAYEISQGTFPGWDATAVGSTIVFVAQSNGSKTGSFSLAQTGAATPAAGSDAETTAGVASTDTWIPQASWNGDPLDGTGTSGYTIDPQMGNVYEIGLQYLGFGAIKFQVEVTYADANNPEFVTVHTIKYPNTSTSTSMSQPSFPFLAAAYSAGSTTDVSVSIGSFAGFNEGIPLNLGPRTSIQLDNLVTSSTSAFTPIFTIRNGRLFKSRVNQTVTNLLDISGVARGNTNAITKFYLVRNAALTGPVNFTSVGSDSAIYQDKAATGMTTPADTDIVYTTNVTQSGDFRYAFSDREITLQPGESMTLCVKSLSATASCTGSLNLREDQ